MSYISIFESFLIVRLPKMARGECVRRGLMKACPQYWHVVVYDCERVGVRVCVCERAREKDQGGVRGRRHAHRFVQRVCIDAWMTACVREAYFKHAAPQTECSRHYCMHLRVCMSVSKSVWVGVCLKYTSISFLSQSCYSTFIPLVGLYPVLLCLWI